MHDNRYYGDVDAIILDRVGTVAGAEWCLLNLVRQHLGNHDDKKDYHYDSGFCAWNYEALKYLGLRGMLTLSGDSYQRSIYANELV